MIAATILISLAFMSSDTAAPAVPALDAKPAITAQPAVPAVPADPTAPMTGLVPKALINGGDALAKSMQQLVESADVYSEEFSAMVEQFPSYAPRSVPMTGAMRIIGSDTMGPLLSNIVISYQVVYPDVKINVDQGGSSKGIVALKGGLCDMASVARDLTAQEVADIGKATGKQVFVVPVARGAACVYVNADNPIAGMTKEQCNGLFSITHSMTEAPIMRWNQLDPTSPLGNTFPPLYVPRATSGTLQLFMEWCMPGEQITTIGRYTEPGPSSVVNACCAYPTAVGISGYANRQARARAVPLSIGAGQPFIAPTVAAICDGTYPLARPLNLVFVATDAQHIPDGIREFLRFTLAEDGQDMAAMTGNIPMDASGIPEFLGTPVKGVWQ
jgi:phosphate transport system substrate-binding protein